MKGFSWLISKYLLQAILPYFILSWLLLSVILFLQQASRFSDIFFGLNIPESLVWQLTLALIPNVIAFTCPMAVLVGVVIGLSRMQGDSELTALRAAGVGNSQLLVPILVLGILLSFFAFFINLRGVPFAAQIVRAVAVKSALYKLESPVEPGVFNTEINGLTIYVKSGDLEKGTWKNIFIFQDDVQNNQLRLITSKSGRIDATDETSELVLLDALVNTIPKNNLQSKLATEKIGEIRLGIKTKRNEIVAKLSDTESAPEELGLSELAAYANSKDGQDRVEARVLWQRRLLLSITPLLFAFLGAGLVLRYNRRGRGFGIFLALLGLIGFYLVSLLGEQIALTGYANVYIAGFLPLFVSGSVIAWLFISTRFFLSSPAKSVKNVGESQPVESRKLSRGNFYIDYTTGILDLDIILNLLKYFLLTFTFLTSIYLIFTAFELWKFAGTFTNGIPLLLTYLIYLIPFIYIQLTPSALMIAILATYVIKSRQNEIVTWTASGQSIYRLLLPCFLLMALFGILNWSMQEMVAPFANRTQDQLRTEIRNRGVSKDEAKTYWVANDRRIYSFELNEQIYRPHILVRNLTVYEFDAEGARLENIYKTPEALWKSDQISFLQTTERVSYIGDKPVPAELPAGFSIEEDSNPFNSFLTKPSHLTASGIREQIEIREPSPERTNLEMALQKKYTTIFLPLIITLFTAPFALSLSRKGRVITVGYAVGIWLLFMGLTSVFDQFGQNGLLIPLVAVWSPILLFAVLGFYLLTRVKT